MAEDHINSKDVLQLVAFKLLQETYAVNISYVQEIIRPHFVTDVPHADKHILGVINLRGQIIPVVDLKIKFGLQVQEQTALTRIMVVSVDNVIVGIVVDAVSEVLRLDVASIEPPSPVISGVESDFIQGVGKDGDNMVIILDIQKILSEQGTNETISLDAASLKLIEG